MIMLMKYNYICLCVVACCISFGLASPPQIGIKSPVSGNLIIQNDTQNGTNVHHPVILFDLNKNYQDLHNFGYNASQNKLIFANKTVVYNATANFVNKTLSKIASGVCFNEVPTITLLKSPKDNVPEGNGSAPHLSRIQICCKGYERNIHNFKKCDPICTKDCINGLCVAPDKCECFPDHVRNLADFCIATCPVGCGNGDCQSDGSCLCKPGYQLDVSKKFCIPKCSQGCTHGNCTEPDVCQCHNGYRLDSAQKCQPICSDGCQNGDCISPEQCTCHSGYEKINKICEPICTKGCANGKCVRPNVCSCEPGWTLDSIGSKCVAHCESSCLNGYCSGANKCTCHTGYVADQIDPMKCTAYCVNGCPNGICSGPNFCICKQGFVKDRSIKGSQSCVPRT